ncbi:TRAP transporter permease DctQ (plasmid) [Alloyangia pacifica]|uniref:TRAP transporter small permease protein n=1 Tax=Alloyangia pacifica TaxID=311180 RepID=A0A2U8HMM7_9RHOB|nr:MULTISPECIES: TRAP transporter small permease subunit [Roseobacteraceae]AWI86165.1 TRAP transporter permease DctQ [Alloyangia pacifica]NDV53499.1 TRAP transporter small permease subunit [Salipiger sp. PrR003]NDW35098.1 TRAP transporter small permease subunit [Salipiger sp. PrR007]
MQKLVTVLTAIARIATGLSFAAIIAAVIIQLLGRSGVISSVVWTEELTRFALLYLAAFGVGLAYRSGDLVNVDIVCEALPGRLPWMLRLICAVITLGFGLMLIKATWLYVSIGARQTAPSLGVRMDFIHASVLVALLSISLFAGLRVAGMLSRRDTGLPEKPEEEL